MAIFRRESALTRASNLGVVRTNRDSRMSTNIPISGFLACRQRCDRQVLYTQLRRTVASWRQSGVVCCSRETDDEVFMTRSLNVTPKITEQKTENIARRLCDSRFTCSGECPIAPLPLPAGAHAVRGSAPCPCLRAPIPSVINASEAVYKRNRRDQFC